MDTVLTCSSSGQSKAKAPNVRNSDAIERISLFKWLRNTDQDKLHSCFILKITIMCCAYVENLAYFHHFWLDLWLLLQCCNEKKKEISKSSLRSIGANRWPQQNLWSAFLQTLQKLSLSRSHTRLQITGFIDQQNQKLLEEKIWAKNHFLHTDIQVLYLQLNSIQSC